MHKDLPVELPPSAALFSMLQGRSVFPLSPETRLHLPLHAEVQELGDSPPHMATPHVPEYGKLIERLCEKAGRPLDEFRGYRIDLSYPPAPTILVMHSPLAERP